MTATLYGDLLAAGVPLAYHESNLYFPCTAQTRAILHNFPESEKSARRFNDDKTGDCWLDVPFAFLPWWERRCAAEAMRAGEIACDIINPGDWRD
jgi:hypothetical protein